MCRTYDRCRQDLQPCQRYLLLCVCVQNEIIEYDAHRITPEMRTAVNRLLAQKGASFEQATIFRVSQAAAPLAAWVIANLQYADVLQKVAPLEKELGGLTANYTQSQVCPMHALSTTCCPMHALARHACWARPQGPARYIQRRPVALQLSCVLPSCTTCLRAVPLCKL